MDRRRLLVPYIQQREKWTDFYSKQADTQSKAKAFTKAIKQDNVKLQMISPVAQIPIEAKEMEKDKKNEEVFAPIKAKFPSPESISSQASKKTTSSKRAGKRKQTDSKKGKKTKKSKGDILN